MKKRMITGTVGMCIMIPVLWFSDTWVFPTLMAVVAAIAGYEMADAAGLGKKYYISIPAAAYCFIITILARIRTLLPQLLPDGIPRSFAVLAVSVLFLFYLLCVGVFAFGKISAKDILCVFALASFAGIAFFSFVMVQTIAPYDYLLILIAAWTGDTFAIFGGKFFGKKKLAPKLSPKKTVAGMICGVVGVIIGFSIYNIIVSLCFDSDINWPLRLALAVPASLIAQLGDLAASAIKRDFGIKDFGKILPGHGGITDRFDSVMFLSIATFLFISAAKYLVPGLV